MPLLNQSSGEGETLSRRYKSLVLSLGPKIRTKGGDVMEQIFAILIATVITSVYNGDLSMLVNLVGLYLVFYKAFFYLIKKSLEFWHSR